MGAAIDDDAMAVGVPQNLDRAEAVANFELETS